MQEGTTHAVTVDRLRSTRGYALVASAEAGPLFCPQWPTSGTWDQTHFMNYQRLRLRVCRCAFVCELTICIRLLFSVCVALRVLPLACLVARCSLRLLSSVW